MLAVLDWYFAFSPTPPAAALLAADTAFIPFGIVAFLVLLAMAATSHDFWLVFLGPPVWKALHMAVYVAYAAVVLHISLGALQDVRNPTIAVVVMLCTATVCALHLAAARREYRRNSVWPSLQPNCPGWSLAWPTTSPKTERSWSVPPTARPWLYSVTATACPRSVMSAPIRTVRWARGA